MSCILHLCIQNVSKQRNEPGLCRENLFISKSDYRIFCRFFFLIDFSQKSCCGAVNFKQAVVVVVLEILKRCEKH